MAEPTSDFDLSDNACRGRSPSSSQTFDTAEHLDAVLLCLTI